MGLSIRTQTMDYIQYREEVLEYKLKKKVDKLLRKGLTMKEINHRKSIMDLRWEYRNVTSSIREWELIW